MNQQSDKLATLGQALRRLALRPVEVGGMISLGAGRGDDMPHFARIWPEASTLLIDMDRRFEAGYLEMQAASPKVRYDICGAAAEDRAGYQTKNDQFGGAIVTDTPASTEGLIETRFKRLDSLVKEHQIDPPYFLKFDTHGAELDILAGATEVLKQTSIIMMECYNFRLNFVGGKNLTWDEMSLHMRGLGFRLIDLCDPLHRPGDGALWQVHLFFIQDSHPCFKRNSYNP